MTDLFISGRDGYHTYRIPGLVATKQGTLLAFCEGRKNSQKDYGDIDLLVKRSTDGGKNWSQQRVVWNDSNNTCGNPCPVVDEQTGVIWLLMTWNRGDDREATILAQTSKDTRRIYVTHSEDDGLTWAKPTDITKDVKAADWTWYATGPGNGIQLRRGDKKGRLVIPCDHVQAKKQKWHSHIIYSDDHGKSWRLGGSNPQAKTNECTVVELNDGRLMLNMRNYNRNKPRAVCFSTDGGETWTGQRTDAALIEPVCQASILRYTWPDAGDKSRILFSNPASSTTREKLTVRLSYDEGNTWPVTKLLHAGPAAYSCLAALPNGAIACLFEAGEKHPYQKIVLAIYPLDWLTDQSARIPPQIPGTSLIFRGGKSVMPTFKPLSGAACGPCLIAGVPLLQCATGSASAWGAN